MSDLVILMYYNILFYSIYIINQIYQSSINLTLINCFHIICSALIRLVYRSAYNIIVNYKLLFFIIYSQCVSEMVEETSKHILSGKSQ